MHKPARSKGVTRWLTRIRIATAVGKTVLTGKPAKVLGRVERGTEIADQALQIFDLIRGK